MRGPVEDQIADHSCRFNPRLCHLCIRRRHIQQIEVAFGACNSRVHAVNPARGPQINWDMSVEKKNVKSYSNTNGQIN